MSNSVCNHPHDRQIELPLGICPILFDYRPNERVASNQTLAFAKGRKVLLTSKKAIFARDYSFFAAVLLYMDKDMLIRGKCKFLLELPRMCHEKYRKTSLLASGLSVSGDFANE